MNGLRRIFLIVFLLAAAVLVGQRAGAQVDAARYFPETGHWVMGEFLRRYEAAENPQAVYGAPITESFDDPVSGWKVQYFEKARFELRPDLPPGLQVRLSTLGAYLYREGQPLEIPANAPPCLNFVETGFSVCYAFRDFFEANGGAAQFGYPISGFEVHDGLIVQYFQNARFEWHPENPAGKRVTVSSLGYRYFYDRREDPTLLNPISGENLPGLPVLSLQVYAFAGTAVMPLNGSQTLYVVVQDQYRNPVTNAEVAFTVVLPDGTAKEYQAASTNAAGVSTLRFDVASAIPGVANVNVVILYDNQALQAETRTSFTLWW